MIYLVPVVQMDIILMEQIVLSVHLIAAYAHLLLIAVLVLTGFIFQDNYACLAQSIVVSVQPLIHVLFVRMDIS